jgi:hypothetical protein
MNKHLGTFLVSTLRQTVANFSYGDQLSSTDLPKRKILLPVNNVNKPDWDFMSEYMQQHENTMVSRYEKYLNTLETDKKPVIDPLRYSEFKIGDLFELTQGKSKGLNHLQENKKGINYLGATNQNNGVLAQVSPELKQIQKGNCIAFIRNGEGSMGYSIYKAEDFIATSDITVGYNNDLNRYVGQYIVSVANRVRGKYNFGYKRSRARLAKETLSLPTTTDGKPDYEYMQAYMQDIEVRQLSRYVAYLKSNVAYS